MRSWFRIAIAALVLLICGLWLGAVVQRQRSLIEQARLSPPQRLANEFADGLARRYAGPVGLVIEWEDECRPRSITVLTHAALPAPAREQLTTDLKTTVTERCGPAAGAYALAFGLAPLQPPREEPRSPLGSALATGLIGLILGVGKWLDCRAGPKNIGRYKLRVKAIHRRLARDSWQRLLWRAVVWTNALLARVFGKSIWAPKSILRAVCASLIINLFLAYPVLLAHLDSGPRLAWLGAFPHILMPAVFACMNVPWDVLSFMAMRELFLRMSNPALGRSRGYLMPTIWTLFGLIVFAWFASGFAVLAGTVLSQLPLSGHVFDGTMWVDLLGPLFMSWYPAAMLHPMTAHLKIQDINMGFMGLGAITACLVLCAMVIVLLVWRYLGAVLRGELEKVTNTFSQDTKSHFSILAVVPAGLVMSCFWIAYVIELLMRSPS